MKKRYILFGLMALSQLIKAKSAFSDTTFQKKKLSKTNIDFAFSYYGQNGNNSAVTGGIGTEKLSVYVINVDVKHQFKELNTFSLNSGIDIISSASTDKIDYRVSSASILDQRVHFDAAYQRQLKKKPVKINGGLGLAFESDYFAFPIHLSVDYTSPSKMQTYQLGFAASIDDLRWGRGKKDEPLTLVYPSELRYKDWYDTHNRYTYQLKTGFTQVLSKKVIMGIFPEFIFQKGLLATPFHRVYFTDDSKRVENLPTFRFRFPLAIKLNAFIGTRFILKNQYGFYVDNFGVRGNSIELEGVVKVNPQFSLLANFRFYHQTSSRYFKPYKEHSIDEIFYTSDYDYAKYNTYKAGVGFKFFPINKNSKKAMMDAILLRYAFYYRSNKLQAHVVSFAFSLATENKK